MYTLTVNGVSTLHATFGAMVNALCVHAGTIPSYDYTATAGIALYTLLQRGVTVAFARTVQ